MTSTAIIVELFLTFELPQPRVAGLRGPGEREEKVGQSESIGPSAHYCPPASTEPPTDIFFSLKPTGINHFFVYRNLESDNLGWQRFFSPLIPGTLKYLRCNPLIFTVWKDFFGGECKFPGLVGPWPTTTCSLKMFTSCARSLASKCHGLITLIMTHGQMSICNSSCVFCI